MGSLFEALVISIYLCMNFNPVEIPLNKPGKYCVTPVKCPEGHKDYPGWCIRGYYKHSK